MVAVLSALVLAGAVGSVSAAGDRAGNRYVCSELARKLDVLARYDNRRDRDFLLLEAARKGCVEEAVRMLDLGLRSGPATGSAIRR